MFEFYGRLVLEILWQNLICNTDYATDLSL